MGRAELFSALAAALGAVACGPSLRDFSRDLARRHEAEQARPPVEDRERSYYERDVTRPRQETGVVILGGGRRLKQGVERAWYPDGTLRFERNHERGEARGWWRSWYPDGTPRSEHFVDPERATEMRWWHPNGRLSSRGLARNALREGPWVDWHPDGARAYAGEYRLGVRNGPWTFWRADGALAERGAYRDGERIGPWERGARGGPQPPESAAGPPGDG